MNKKKVILLSFPLILVLSIFLTWFYFGEPKEFPNEQTIVSKMNAIFPESKPKEILDQLFLDKKHVYVPFITEEGNYGSSYWVWKNRSWQVATISNRGEPHLWKINKKDSSAHYLVWNMDPNDTVKEIDFYLIKDRNYLISDGVHTLNRSYK